MQRILYKMEHSFVLLVSIYIYSLYGISWLWFLLYLAVPDVVCLLPVMLLKNERAYKEIQRHLYEFSHSYIIVILLGLTIYLLTDFIVWSFMGWVVHIALDRIVSHNRMKQPSLLLFRKF